jgi:hypothetical protein
MEQIRIKFYHILAVLLQTVVKQKMKGCCSSDDDICFLISGRRMKLFLLNKINKKLVKRDKFEVKFSACCFSSFITVFSFSTSERE